MDDLGLAETDNMRKRKLVGLFIRCLYTMQFCFYFLKLMKKQNEKKSLRCEMYVLDFFINRKIVHRLAYESDATCIAQLRMDRCAFAYLCTRLETVGGLKPSRHLLVDEKVAMFLHIIAHHVKNRVITFKFMRSGQSVSKYFHDVLYSILWLHGELLKQPDPVPENSTDERWKWFKVLLLAIYLL